MFNSTTDGNLGELITRHLDKRLLSDEASSEISANVAHILPVIIVRKEVLLFVGWGGKSQSSLSELYKAAGYA